MPRWVKIFVIIGATITVVLVASLLIDGGGDHGPRRHTGIGSERSTADQAHPTVRLAPPEDLGD